MIETPEIFIISQIPYFVLVVVFFWELIKIRKNLSKMADVIEHEGISDKPAKV